MNAQQVARGIHLRRCRKEKKMTLQDLSNLTGLSTGFLSKIENGVGNPSVNNIQKICYALDITVNELMVDKAAEELYSTINENKSYVLPGADRCLIYNYANMVRYEALYEGNPHFKVNVMTLAGGTGEQFRSIHSHDEFGIVAKGQMTIDLGGELHNLREGDCVMVRARTQHAIISTSSEECISYWVEMVQEPGR